MNLTGIPLRSIPAGYPQRVCRVGHSREPGERPGARCSRRRRRGKGQGHPRAVGSGGSPIRTMRGDAQAPETRCGTTRDERARDREVLHARWGVHDPSGVDASPAQGLTPESAAWRPRRRFLMQEPVAPSGKPGGNRGRHTAVLQP